MHPVRVAVWIAAAGAAGLAGWFAAGSLIGDSAPRAGAGNAPASQPATTGAPTSTAPISAAAREAAERARIGQGDYSLITDTGAPFTAATLSGKPSAVFFGYTHCPDVCPTTLGDITVWQDALGERAQGLRIYFVTVDPERDSAPMLAEYLSWSTGITGVTGNPDEVAKALQSFAVSARRVDGAEGDYTMDHSAFVMLFNHEGHFVDQIGYQEPAETALPKLEKLLAQ